ncbi:MAG: flavodoxin family protein [Gemmatimonadota bacterium]|nr:flavodoxin family protein [Gemmatimonadota bacterium]
MNVLCIQGSPRKKGSTAKVLGWVEDELRSQGHQARQIHIADLRLEGCVGCYQCQADPDELVCSRRDGGLEIFRRMKEADAVIYATPLYCWGFTSQIKPLIDRHVCLSTGYGNPSRHRSHFEGKRMALLVTAGGPEGEGNTELISQVFKRLADFIKADVAAELIVPFLSGPSDLGSEHREKARAFAGAVIG